MKPIILSLVAASALAGCAVHDGAYRESVSAALPNPAATGDQRKSGEEPGGYATAPVGTDTYEVTYSGRWLGSRDAIEGRLLYRAALAAKQHGKTWFRFLHMPGEAGPSSHPGRASPAFGAAYGHWQPHWTYRVGSTSQPWHPEWGAPFWAETLSGQGVKHVEAHAMIELGNGPFKAAQQTDFGVAAVLKDLPSYRD